ncbi:MAG: fumarate hydratase C-terminal domain-containing protein [Alphaproteobacteria bacterium]|jgi:L(+)-tartrate dehydratase beta subunit
MADAGKFKKIRLNTEPTPEALAALNIGDIVYLDGTVYTGREGVYMRALQDGETIPMDLPTESGANFHCSPAASIADDGTINMGSVTATASFRFSKWIGDWLTLSGAKLILGKGGMSSADYKQHFVPNGAIYLTTVGYGTGALLGRGIKRVKDVHWRKELGLAQAIWVLEVENFGPFIVESDLEGNSLFERENAKIAAGLEKVYEGTRPAVLKRFGETDDRTDEMI